MAVVMMLLMKMKYIVIYLCLSLSIVMLDHLNIGMLCLFARISITLVLLVFSAIVFRLLLLVI